MSLPLMNTWKKPEKGRAQVALATSTHWRSTSPVRSIFAAMRRSFGTTPSFVNWLRPATESQRRFSSPVAGRWNTCWLTLSAKFFRSATTLRRPRFVHSTRTWRIFSIDCSTWRITPVRSPASNPVTLRWTKPPEACSLVSWLCLLDGRAWARRRWP